MTGGTGNADQRRFRLFGLDPANRLAELTSGITVVLTILVGTSFVADDVDDPRDVLVGLAVVAAFASGLSGGIMNVIESLYDDAALRRDELTITHADLTERRALVRRLLDDHIDVDIDDEAADRVVEAILDEPPESVRVRAIDVRDVIASVVLNLLAMLPVVLVFWLIDDWHTALLVAEIVLVAALFVVGYFYGFRLRFAPIVCGQVMLGVGLALVGISTLSDSL